jgi:hypothetical protein
MYKESARTHTRWREAGREGSIEGLGFSIEGVREYREGGRHTGKAEGHTQGLRLSVLRFNLGCPGV